MGSGAARALLAAGLCAAGVAALYVLAFHTATGVDEDNRVYMSFLAVNAPRVEDRAASLTEFLNVLPFSIAVAIVLVAASLTGSLRAAAAVAAIFVGANLTTQLLQALTDVPRGPGFPPETKWPSGHTCAAATLAIGVVLATPARLRPIAAGLGTLGLVTIALSIMLTATHRLSDVLAGLLVAGAWAAVVGLVWRVPPARVRGAAWSCAGAAAIALVPLILIVLEYAPEERHVGPAFVAAGLATGLGTLILALATRLPEPAPARLLSRAARR